MKVIRGQTTVTFAPTGARREHLIAVGEPVDLTEFLASTELGVTEVTETMARMADAARMATISFNHLGEVFGKITIPGWYWHGWVKHQRDLRRWESKDEIRRMGWSRR